MKTFNEKRNINPKEKGGNMSFKRKFILSRNLINILIIAIIMCALLANIQVYYVLFGSYLAIELDLMNTWFLIPSIMLALVPIISCIVFAKCWIAILNGRIKKSVGLVGLLATGAVICCWLLVTYMLLINYLRHYLATITDHNIIPLMLILLVTSATLVVCCVREMYLNSNSITKCKCKSCSNHRA